MRSHLETTGTHREFPPPAAFYKEGSETIRAVEYAVGRQ